VVQLQIRRPPDSQVRTRTQIGAGSDLATSTGMAFFWERPQTPNPSSKPAPLSALAIALLTLLQLGREAEGH
jgi:hypothetical protein